MNILPLILALALILSVLSVEKLEKYKNQMAVEKQYRFFLNHDERKTFNTRQKKLFKNYDKDIKQLSFRYIVDKEARDKHKSTADQFRILLVKLMQNLYGEAPFFKKLKLERNEFFEELLDGIEKSADKAPKNLIRKIGDISRLDLEDEKLQEAFYLILKGTATRKELSDQKKLEEINKESKNPFKEKGYVSLFAFINYNGKDQPHIIKIQKAPREILKTIFDNDDVVEAIIEKRHELEKSGGGENGIALKEEFSGKVNGKISTELLDFKVSKGDKKNEYD